jgi:hypothetical protein
MMNDYGQPYGQPALAPRTNGKAIAALACGIGGFIVFPAAIMAIVLGHVARGEIEQTGEAGGGMATAGLILGYVGTVIGIILIAALILLIHLLESWS